MSSDKEKLNELTVKVDKILKSLNDISEEMRSVSAQMKTLASGQITHPQAAPAPAPTIHEPAAITKQRSLDEIRMSFPEELESRLGFEEKGDYIIIKPKAFLGTETLRKSPLP